MEVESTTAEKPAPADPKEAFRAGEPRRSRPSPSHPRSERLPRHNVPPSTNMLLAHRHPTAS